MLHSSIRYVAGLRLFAFIAHVALKFISGHFGFPHTVTVGPAFKLQSKHLFFQDIAWLFYRPRYDANLVAFDAIVGVDDPVLRVRPRVSVLTHYQ